VPAGSWTPELSSVKSEHNATCIVLLLFGIDFFFVRLSFFCREVSGLRCYRRNSFRPVCKVALYFVAFIAP
jgi:hypothetical protein